MPSRPPHRPIICALFALASLTAVQPVAADVDPHARHRLMAANVSVTDAHYDIPDLALRDPEGRQVALRDLLADDRPIALNFIFTSCTTVCPVMTATFLQMQRTMRAERIAAPRFVSISIDPDFDTGPVLSAYAQRFGADWTFLTGSEADVERVLRAFAAYRGGKANHAAVTLLHAARGRTWTRIEGLAPSEHLVSLWKSLADSG